MFHQQDHLKSHLPDSHTASRQLFHCRSVGSSYNTQLATGDTWWQPTVLQQAFPAQRGPPRCWSTWAAILTDLHHQRATITLLCLAFGRRDHLTRHLKKSHAQESGLMPPCTPSTPVATPTPAPQCPVKEEPSPVVSDMGSVSKEPWSLFLQGHVQLIPNDQCCPWDGSPSWPHAGVIVLQYGCGPPYAPPNLLTITTCSLLWPSQQQQPYSKHGQVPARIYLISSRRRGTVSCWTCRVCPRLYLSAVNSSTSTSASPQREVLG
ncbi:hypothetical protein KUCAC02_012308 [Chaenocephalus aceratus]|uniref:Uncharacterized protein n=1 Tax=Chaenocephalus aceratus TaxID=36190 RepID=A0ACB9XBB8_CHAAC|nr:hypothetical protein KUCAC02_012308 [Chaenocephalus aceratus]